PTTRDERTVEGAINSFISDGILKDEKKIHDGQSYFVPEGETPSDRTIRQEMFKEAARGVLDRDQYTVSGGLITIRPKIEGRSAENSEHRIIADKMLEYFSSETVTASKNPVNETNLRLNLIKILTDMGISVISM